MDHKSVSMCDGFTAVLAVVCALTKFTLYIPVKRQTGEETLRVLMSQVFAVFGCPLVIISDNGTAFANELMKASEQLYGYRWVFVMPHTPQANGLAEAAVKKLKIILDRHTNEYANWLPIVPMAQLCVNQRITSGMSSPFASVFGVAPTTLAALENPELLPRTTAAQREVHETRLHQRLKREIDAVKAAAALADGTLVPRIGMCNVTTVSGSRTRTLNVRGTCESTGTDGPGGMRSKYLRSSHTQLSWRCRVMGRCPKCCRGSHCVNAHLQLRISMTLTCCCLMLTNLASR